MRLDKALTLFGITRSQAKRAIADGRAAVGGVTERDAGANVNPADVTLDGETALPENVTLMLHKPAGVVTATSDRRDRTVMEFIPDDLQNRPFGPVGRLDKDVTGLVLMTTDGQLAHRLISPKRGVEKVYEALVEGDMDEPALEMIRRGGMVFKDFTSKPAKAERIGPSRVRLTLTEGKFHEVKRICERAGHPVVALKRASIAGVVLDPALEEGAVRLLTDAETEKLYRAAGMDLQGGTCD